jgi:hypothetical protein
MLKQFFEDADINTHQHASGNTAKLDALKLQNLDSVYNMGKKFTELPKG